MMSKYLKERLSRDYWRWIDKIGALRDSHDDALLQKVAYDSISLKDLEAASNKMDHVENRATTNKKSVNRRKTRVRKRGQLHWDIQQ